METSNRIPIVHSIECRDLIHSHWRHLQYPRDLIHDTNAREPMLPLSEVKQWHDSRLLVLAWISAEHFLDEVLIHRVELERDRGIVVGCISVLDRVSKRS